MKLSELNENLGSNGEWFAKPQKDGSFAVVSKSGETSENFNSKREAERAAARLNANLRRTKKATAGK